MSKKSNSQNKKNNTSDYMGAVSPNRTSKQDLEDTIVKALLSYDQARKESDKKIAEKEFQDRHTTLGYKDYSQRKGIVRLILVFFNRLGVFIRILFMPRDKIKGDFATTNLMKFAVSFLFSAAKLLLWAVSFVTLLSYPLSLITPNLEKMDLSAYPTYLCIGIISFIFAQLFRIASIEIEKMEDHNYIVDVFAAVAAIVAIIISIIHR